MDRSLVAQVLVWSGAVLSAVALAVSASVAADDPNARVATMILPITVLAVAGAVAVTRGSGWSWLRVLIEVPFIVLAMASLGVLFIPGLVLGLAGTAVGRRTAKRRRPPRNLLSA